MDSLVEILRFKLIPRAQDNLEKRLIVAQAVIKKSSVPHGVELIKNPSRHRPRHNVEATTC